MGEVTVRPALPSDIPLLSYWHTTPHVIAASGDDDSNDWADELARLRTVGLGPA